MTTTLSSSASTILSLYLSSLSLHRSWTPRPVLGKNPNQETPNNFWDQGCQLWRMQDPTSSSSMVAATAASTLLLPAPLSPKICTSCSSSYYRKFRKLKSFLSLPLILLSASKNPLSISLILLSAYKNHLSRWNDYLLN